MSDLTTDTTRQGPADRMKEYVGRDVKAWKAGSWKWHVACLVAIVLGFGLLAVGLQIPGVVMLLAGTVLVWVSMHVHGKLGGNEQGHWYGGSS